MENATYPHSAHKYVTDTHNNKYIINLSHINEDIKMKFSFNQITFICIVQYEDRTAFLLH